MTIRHREEVVMPGPFRERGSAVTADPPRRVTDSADDITTRDAARQGGGGD